MEHCEMLKVYHFLTKSKLMLYARLGELFDLLV